MKVEIWSDIMCPFCYIGKRRFEESLAQFGNSQNIEIEWKSFLLSPDMKTDPSKSIHQFLAEHKGVSLEEAKGMNQYVTDMAASVGLRMILIKPYRLTVLTRTVSCILQSNTVNRMKLKNYCLKHILRKVKI